MRSRMSHPIPNPNEAFANCLASFMIKVALAYPSQAEPTLDFRLPKPGLYHFSIHHVCETETTRPAPALSLLLRLQNHRGEVSWIQDTVFPHVVDSFRGLLAVVGELPLDRADDCFPNEWLGLSGYVFIGQARHSRETVSSVCVQCYLSSRDIQGYDKLYQDKSSSLLSPKASH